MSLISAKGSALCSASFSVSGAVIVLARLADSSRSCSSFFLFFDIFQNSGRKWSLANSSEHKKSKVGKLSRSYKSSGALTNTREREINPQIAHNNAALASVQVVEQSELKVPQETQPDEAVKTLLERIKSLKQEK